MLESGIGAQTEMVIDRGANAIVFTTFLSGTRQLAFEAWTLPQHVRHWWDPAGLELVECEIDLRPGGRFKFLNQASDHAFSGVYREIKFPDRIVFEAMGATGRVLFEDATGGTLLTVRIECASQDHLAQFVAMGVDVGTSRTIENLVRYIRRCSGLHGMAGGPAELPV